tara:strand:- start:498 stop:728 length:231 start_codon:yes stop_codon:yes gene_type:complete
MAHINNLAPSLFMLNEKMQLEAGNQMVQLLKSRLKTWQRVNEVVSGAIKFSELGEDERITQTDINLLTHKPSQALN